MGVTNMFRWLDRPWMRHQLFVDDGGGGTNGGGATGDSGDGNRGDNDTGGGSAGNDGGGPTNDGGSGDDKTYDEKYVKSLRDEAAKYRVGQKRLQEQFDALKDGIAKALGLKPDEKDPEALSKQLAELNAKYRQERTANAFQRAAAKLGADAELTWAVLQVQGKLSELDPDADGFADQLAALVEAAIKANPKLKAGTTPNQSGGDFGGGAQGDTLTMEAIAKMTPDEINKDWPRISKLLEAKAR